MFIQRINSSNAIEASQDPQGTASPRGRNANNRTLPKSLGPGTVVNDIHSQLNQTRVNRVARPDSIEAVQTLVAQARAEGRAVSIAGGRHSMGGQQFGSDTILVDTTAMNRVLHFDSATGLVEVEAGIRWPELLEDLGRRQDGQWPQWGIRQKQTGADRLSIGGALSANVHGRGLTFKPFIDDVESFTLVNAEGRVLNCSRRENAELFKLAIGGYGLFGVIVAARLRLVRRRKVERIVNLLQIEELIGAVEQRIADGFLYGDFQFSIDPHSQDFLRKGVFSCYRPVDDAVEIPKHQLELSVADWMRLFYWAHTNKSRAFDAYSAHYLSTSGQKYWSDSHQLSPYVDDYHRRLNVKLWPEGCGTEMITEVYVPRKSLVPFLGNVRYDLRATAAELIYGTIRFSEKDQESFLPWAKDPCACVIFNLHTAHTREALNKTAGDFRRLIDRAIEYGGCYYLTYHRWATREQVEACYPQFPEFLRLKKSYDPEERWESEWYRHYKAMFGSPSNVKRHTSNVERSPSNVTRRASNVESAESV